MSDNQRYKEYNQHILLQKLCKKKIRKLNNVLTSLQKNLKKNKINLKLLHLKEKEPLSGNLDLDVHFRHHITKTKKELIKKIQNIQVKIRKYKKKLIYYKDSLHELD